MMIRKDKKFNWITLITCCLAALTVLPIVIASAYSFYRADDFSNARVIGIFGEDIVKTFVNALKFTKMRYLGWQGTYTSMFLQAFLSPLNGFGDIQLRIIMVLNAILFVISLRLFIGSVCKSMNISELSRWVWTIFSLCIIVILGFTSWTQIFYWFTGAVNYSFPMSFGLLGMACMLQAKKKWYVLSAVLMFLASGGSLEVAGIGCFVLLGICILKKATSGINVWDYTVFGVTFAGALINAAAPGNYLRQGHIDNKAIHLLEALRGTVEKVIGIFGDMVFNTPLVLIIFISVLIGAQIGRNRKESKRKESLIIILICILVPFVTCFPVVLGYGYSSKALPNRCVFIAVIVLAVSSIMIAGIIGYTWNGSIHLCSRYTAVIMIMFLIIMGNLNSSWKISNSVPFRMWREIGKGSYKSYYNEVKTIYDKIESDSNKDVFIYGLPDSIDTFQTIDISEDMSSWVNVEMAQYFGKNSVQFVSDIISVQNDGQKNIRISPDTFEAGGGYLSVFQLDDAAQVTETLYLLEPLDSNKVFSIPADETGKIAIYLFADSEGTVPLDAIEKEF